MITMVKNEEEIHIMTDQSITGVDLATVDGVITRLNMRVSFCGKITHFDGEETIKYMRFQYFNRGKILASGESLRGGNNESIAGMNAVGTPMILFHRKNTLWDRFCDKCRFAFYGAGGIILTFEAYERMIGKGFEIDG